MKIYQTWKFIRHENLSDMKIYQTWKFIRHEKSTRLVKPITHVGSVSCSVLSIVLRKNGQWCVHYMYIATVQLLQYILFVYIEFIYFYWVWRLSLTVTGCMRPEHQCRISNWIYILYGTPISQSVMRNSISLVVDSAEGLGHL